MCIKLYTVGPHEYIVTRSLLIGTNSSFVLERVLKSLSIEKSVMRISEENPRVDLRYAK